MAIDLGNIEPTTDEAAPAAEAPAAEAAEAPAKKRKAPIEVPEGTEFGTNSGDVAFIGNLGDPSRPDRVEFKNPKTGQTETKSLPTCVGYRFKALADITVPDFGIPQSLHKDPMDVDPNMLSNTRKIKKGQEFDLTLAETGALISLPQYNGVFDGGDMPVSASYQQNSGVSKSGDVEVDDTIPRISLRAPKGHSVKKAPFHDVLSFKDTVLENGQKRKERTINKGFEKFESLTYIGKTGIGRNGKPTAASVGANENALAFLALLQEKKKKSAK